MCSCVHVTHGYTYRQECERVIVSGTSFVFLALGVPDLMPYTLNSLSIDVHLSKAQEPHGGRDPQNLATFIAHKGWCQIVENRIISHSKIS